MNLLARKQLRGTDNLSTPVEAVTPLLQYLPQRIWECAPGEGKLARILQDAGRTITAPQIDFLTEAPRAVVIDAIVTNPPYSLKTKFLQRAYALGLPFAFLLPITALEGTERQRLYRENGLQLLILPKRIDFTGKRAPWFAVAWFTWGLNLEHDLTFSV